MASRQNPISFKTVPNRNKTQKWQQAKTYNYDGDDWGGYDPYDEYAYDDPPQPPMPPPPQQYGPQGYSKPPFRKNSFDQGDERRNFSAGPVMYGADSRSSASPARSNVSGGDYGTDGRPRSRPRDFTNPEQVPPPLNMRGSPAPATFPPRKSSVSSGSPAPEAVPISASRKEDKELPIPPMIRPSDIYKRMEAEREKERQSMEGSRPSKDSLQRDADAEQQRGRSLSSVQEDFGEPMTKNETAGPPLLPSMRNMSGIGTSFLHGSDEVSAATRAPEGKDPAAEIMSERAETRAPPGSDPAADILAERAPTRADPGSDPAADIMAERGHTQAVDEPESGVDLKHQPSSGYRSMVNRAFDDDEAVPSSSSLSRDSSVYSQSVGGTGVSRNNSNSTAGISPIMSRVPSAATSKMQQQERERQVPTIAEEPSQRYSGEQQIPRKPSPSGTPSHSRNVSRGSGEVIQPGYRRSLDPPSGDNSPARTPGLENAHSRRLSQPLSAETEHADPPAVADQGVEMMPTLEPAATPVGELPTTAPLPTQGRSRAGTDYSMRESDIAREASTSPEKNEFSPTIAQAANAEQTAFLQDHAGTPTSQWPPALASGRSSPAKGRVREIAGKYQTIEAESRRGSTTSSKSSWSNFRGSDENLPGLKKRTTDESGMGSELGQTTSESRPGMASQMSYRPGLPGQWVSYAPTPGETPAPAVEQPASRHVETEEETPDFSPNTDKHQLAGHSAPSSEQAGLLTQAKNAGEALGASVMSTVGVGHQTRDFASNEPPAPVEQPRSHKPTGDMGHLNAPDRPELSRGDTEASMATDIASSASSVPPTPPAKDGLAALGAQHGQAPRQRQLQEDDRPISNYFSGAVAPLQPQKGHSRDNSANLDVPTYGPMTNMSTDPGEGDLESDRLRKEIVRSLSPSASREDSAALTQDALDAPDNMRRVEAGEPPEPAVETMERPSLGLLNQRFSWEDRAESKGVLDSSPAAARTRDMPTVNEPEPDPEVIPEMPYERPRSRGLHIMNPEDADSSDDDKPLQQAPRQLLDPGEKGIVSPISSSQENLRDGLGSRDISQDDMTSDGPNVVPIGGGLEVLSSRRDSDGGSGTRVPSYYTQGQPDNFTLPKSPSLTQQFPKPEPPSPTSPQTAIPDDRSPTSATRPRTSTTATTGKIPPFREIIANKDARKRMDLYRDTRQTFADTHTGLSDWLDGMLERNPEYAHIGTHLQPSATSVGTLKGHKHSPSLAKFKQLGSSFAGDAASGSGIRRTSTQRDASGAAPAVPAKDAVWEQRGKDLMKGAGMLGGKAQAGAKGLLMKGRSRFGTKRESGSRGGGGGDEKALPPLPPTTSASPFPARSTSDPPSIDARHTPSRSLTGTSRNTDSLVVPSALTSQGPSSNASSAAPSRTPSQAPSRTPSTLSRTLSRLRSRRSQSQTSTRADGSRSRSRPGSLVLSTSNLDTASASAVPIATELGVVDDASPVAITSFPAGATGLVHTTGPATGRREGDVISPWSEPDEFVSAERNQAISPWSEPGEPILDSVVEERRLGVLPSPTATAFSGAGESPVKGPRSRQGSAVSGLTAGEGRGRKGSHVDEVIREEGDGDVDVRERDMETYEELQRGWGTDSEAESVGGEDVRRNKMRTGDSDRAFLPSQLKRPSAPQSPTADEEELYESTPRQAQFSRTEVGVGAGQETPTAAKKDGDVFAEGEERSVGGELDTVKRENSASDAAGLRGRDDGEDAVGGAEDGAVQTVARAADPHDETSEPSSTRDWDKRSEISADEDFHDARDGDDTDLPYHAAASRRSSVSSMGNTAAQEPMSAQAVPAGPAPSTQDRQAKIAQQERFMNRPYRFGGERPMSYMPPGTTDTGAPVQETLTDDTRPESASVDISGMSGPPVGVLPYQKHPAMRDVHGGLPGDHGGLRSPPPAPDANPLASPASGTPRPQAQSRQVSAEIKSPVSKRFSSFFRSRRPSQSAATTVYGPAPSAISDHYGIENLPTGSAAVVTPGVEVQQVKRKSGIWDSFKRSSLVLADESRQSSVVAPLTSQPDVTTPAASQPPRETPPPRTNTLKKPQRATTNATPPDPAKKKRFSVLGSLFGRSSTAGRNTERPRKLMKQPNPSREASQAHLPNTSSVTTGYEAFEAERRRQARQKVRPQSPEIGLPLQERADLTTAAISFPHRNAGPPPQGWYGPEQAPRQEQQQQHFRVLHSEHERVGAPLDNVPEAFRPVEASYGRPVAPVRPPPQQLYSPPMSPVGQRSYSAGQYPSMSPPPAQRHASYSSNEYQLSSQVSGRSEYQQQQEWQHRGSAASISPVHSRSGSDSFPPPRQARVGSISEQMAGGPGQQGLEYGSQQQRPWAVSMPPPERERTGRSVSNPTWGYQGRGEDYLPHEEYGYNGGGGPYPHMQVPKQRMPGPSYAQQPPSQGQGRYSSAPYSPQSGAFQQSSAYPYPTGSPPQLQQRFYARPPPSSQPYPPRQYSGHQRSGSGSESEYIGRRDEPALGEEQLAMRGTSYPGQEWTPGRWD